ncbi:dynamin-like GTPase family protein [Oscillatoria sp. FACHB-1406]|uniref:dynamin-like GTPase family protein n=1 Tax=Oscillatoria sp. FACHB-1406 TaxID=2692846 RepID=UPI001683D4B5|nr:dynamin-like GTPase family protein [Oscillatoria sp. FACHB-1406]MBD2580222.1 dynamin-like GTPase family protein [Oscillatoria sp. FACHB-1406]
MKFDTSKRTTLQEPVQSILRLWEKEPKLKAKHSPIAVEASLKKALSPRFEIVFAGAFSAGKSMLINALLGRELLYSAEGHATGTECYIEYAEAGQERVVLTFSSEAEIGEQVKVLCERLGLNIEGDFARAEVLELLQKASAAIIQTEGGESKSDRAKQAKGLQLLIEGFTANRDRIHAKDNAIYSMEQLHFSNLSEAASYARRGSNSAVLKRLNYFCCHPLLNDGNILVDLPGIDAPVKKDSELTYRKIEDSETSAVIAVLKPAAAGEMTKEETELLEKMRSNPGVRDRVFYVFNRIDETWYNTELRKRLENLIQEQFQDITRLYKTSGLLGFYGSQVKGTTARDRFGLDTLFAENVKGFSEEEETPQFVSEFNNYCANSGKLTRTQFKVSVNGYDTPNENYTRILGEWGNSLIDRLIEDSGIEEFRAGITRYLTEEKHPQLIAALADDLAPICTELKNRYLEIRRDLDSQPQEIEAMKARELERLNQQLQEAASELQQLLETEVNQVITNADPAFEEDFQALKAKMVTRLDELLQTFSVMKAYRCAVSSHPRNSTAPLIAVLVEALYSLANDLELVLVEYSETIARNFCTRLLQRLRKTETYRSIYRLLGNDGGIEFKVRELEKGLISGLTGAAKVECDRYVRESPRFYDEGTFSIYQFRQTLQQTSQGYDAESMVEAEPAIRQLLKLDFEPKVSLTIRSTFRQTINQTLKTNLLPMAEQQKGDICKQYGAARSHLEKTLEREALEKLYRNQERQQEVEENIEAYGWAISTINQYLDELTLFDKKLPDIDGFQLSGSQVANSGILKRA